MLPKPGTKGRATNGFTDEPYDVIVVSNEEANIAWNQPMLILEGEVWVKRLTGDTLPYRYRATSVKWLSFRPKRNLPEWF